MSSFVPVVVSNEGKEKLINMIPELKTKTEVFFNIISCNIIEKMSSYGEITSKKKIYILKKNIINNEEVEE